MTPDTEEHNRALEGAFREVCDLLALEINRHLPDSESKV